MASKNASEKYTLTAQELRALVEHVREQQGDLLSRAEFSDAALGVFEDIPGFEAIRKANACRIIRQLWSIYHDKENRQA